MVVYAGTRKRYHARRRRQRTTTRSHCDSRRRRLELSGVEVWPASPAATYVDGSALPPPAEEDAAR